MANSADPDQLASSEESGLISGVVLSQIRRFYGSKSTDIFLISPQNICCEYSLEVEVPH